MKNKLISIVVPIYKVEKYLDKCIISIVNQTYKNLEIILVDDGSPDSCPKICDDWEKKDSRIKVIHKKNGGLSDARNFGIDVAKGDYIMFVDSDDFVDESICEKLLLLIEKYNADFSMCGFQNFFEDEEVKNNSELKTVETIFSGDEVIDALFNKNCNYLMTAWGKLYKKDLFKDLRYAVGKLNEDEYIIHHLLSKTKTFVTTNEKLYFYLQRKGSITSSKKFGRKNMDGIYAFIERYEFFVGTKFEQKALNQLINSLIFVLYIVERQNNYELKEDVDKLLNKYYSVNKHKTLKQIVFKNFKCIRNLIYNRRYNVESIK